MFHAEFAEEAETVPRCHAELVSVSYFGAGESKTLKRAQGDVG